MNIINRKVLRSISGHLKSYCQYKDIHSMISNMPKLIVMIFLLIMISMDHGLISSPIRLLFRRGQTGNWCEMSLSASVCVKNVFEGNFLALKITIYEWLGVIKYHWKFILHTHAYDVCFINHRSHMIWSLSYGFDES